MNSFEKNVRIVCRMKSVDVTRVIPSRCAASVAIVDLPVPVAPPTSRSERLVEPLQRIEPTQSAYGPRRFFLADQLGRELAEPVEVERHRHPAPRDRGRP